MKSKSQRLLSGNTRSRLLITLGLAVVLPALTLIYVNFQHVKSIQRDKKVEALIHRDFQYILSISEKKINQKTYALVDQAKELFPHDSDTDADKRKKLTALLAQSPWFSHAFIYDADKGDKSLILEAQPKTSEPERERLLKNYSGWFKMEGRETAAQINRRTKRLTWWSGESDTPNGPTYSTTVLFTFPYLPKNRPVFGGASFDTKYLKETFFPEALDDAISKKLADKEDRSVAGMLHELNPPDPEQSHKDERLAMMLYLADAGSGRGYREFAASPTWGTGKPEVSQNLDDPFRGLGLGIKFQGTTAEAISRRWVF